MSCGALNMCSKCKTCLLVFPVSSLLLVPPSQVLNYTETFYAPPVVMVTVSHLYDSNNVYSVEPENNVLNAWIEVR